MGDPGSDGVRVWLAAGNTDMRRGMNGLAFQVQQLVSATRILATSTCSEASAVTC